MKQMKLANRNDDIGTLGLIRYKFRIDPLSKKAFLMTPVMK